MRFSFIQKEPTNMYFYNAFMQNSAPVNNYPAILDDGNTVGFWDFTNLSKLVKNEDNLVSEVQDIRGGSYPTLVQSILQKMPISSEEGCTFDGVDDNVFSQFELGSEYIIYYVDKHLSFPIARAVPIDGYSGGALLYNNSTPTNIWMFQGGAHEAQVGEGLYLNEKRVITASVNTPNSFLRVNKNYRTTPYAIFPSVSDANGIYVSSRRDESWFSNSLFCEIIVRKITDTNENQDLIIDYLTSKYNL